MYLLVGSRIFLSLVVLICLMNTVSASELKFVGKAYSLSDDRLLYTENHSIDLDANGNYQKGSVKYVDAQGKTIASKSLDFAAGTLIPELYFIDYRDDASIQIKRESTELELVLKDEKESRSEKLSTLDTTPLVADAGFDRFVISNWDDLIGGKKLHFEFLALTRGEFISFYIQRETLSDEFLDLKIRPKNWLIGMLVDSIYLRYQRSDRLLKEFRGVTNIRALREGRVSSDNYQARIEYQYITSEDQTSMQ